MKGIILAGGAGTRLYPLTKVTSKQLLPVYNKPLIYYPLETMIRAGIREILIVIAPENAGDFVKLLGSGREFGASIAYEVQEKPEGIAQAFLIGEKFIGKDSVALMLGDNIFDDDFSGPVGLFKSGAQIFVKRIPDPQRFGVAELAPEGRVLSLEEKPAKPKSNYAQTGLYLCDNSVVEKAHSLKFSARGELEITDVMKMYLKEGTLTASVIQGEWFDTGTHESLFAASAHVRQKVLQKGAPGLSVALGQPLQGRRQTGKADASVRRPAGRR